MGAIHIDNIDEQVLHSIRVWAKRHNRSFEDEVRNLLAEAVTRGSGRDDSIAQPNLSPEERVAIFERAQAMTSKGVQQTDSADIIRNIRDGRGDVGERLSPSEREARVAEADRLRAMTKGWSPETDSVAVIREIRDRDR